MKRSFVVLIALIPCVVRAQVWPRPDVDLDEIVRDTSMDPDEAFGLYMDAFGKSYDDNEYNAHKAAFLESLQYIRDHKADASFKVGLTSMADQYALDVVDDDTSDEDQLSALCVCARC